MGHLGRDERVLDSVVVPFTERLDRDPIGECPGTSVDAERGIAGRDNAEAQVQTAQVPLASESRPGSVGVRALAIYIRSTRGRASSRP
jgi:hypothetical protein